MFAELVISGGIFFRPYTSSLTGGLFNGMYIKHQ